MNRDMFDSAMTFKRAFVQGLASILETFDPQTELGAFILVVANFCHDPGVREALGSRLDEALARVLSVYDKQLVEPAGNGDSEDMQVLRRVKAVGLDAIAVTRYRSVGPYVVQFNELRSFRPKGVGAAPVTFVDMPVDFTKVKFHFDIERVQIERVGEKEFELEGRKASLFYNKFPFANVHAVLVLDKTKLYRQVLQKDKHEWACAVARLLGAQASIGLGYNSFGAFASVPQLHWQTFMYPPELPLMNPTRQFNSGTDTAYPLPVAVFKSAAESWDWIAQCHRENTAYNLLYVRNTIYCIARRLQGSYVHADWTSGFAWFECAGAIIVSAPGDFESMTEAAIVAEYKKMAVD